MKLFKEESDNLLILMDNEIEEFYINFRNSMFNFYKEHSFTRPLKQWSDKLNAYQKQQDYELIEETIIKIISLYACDLMRVGSDYNINILNSNIKRWNRISKNNISSSNLIFVLHEIYCVFEKNRDINDYHFLFHQLELYLIYKDFTQLIEYSVEKGTISVLDKLMDYEPKILAVIIKMYDLQDINPNVKISSKKLYREIKK